MSDIYGKLNAIQCSLVAAKGNYNSFGKYHYRSCENILESLKPHLAEHKLALVMSDEIKAVGNRVYIEATVTLIDGDSQLTVKAMAREEETKKGMDGSQITGSASSYARKYALCGMFAIDDNKDADALNVSDDFTEHKEERDALIKQAELAASNGITAFQDFFTKDLSKEQRKLLGDAEKERLKLLAAQVGGQDAAA